jgi:hypothetical protein
MAAVPLWKTFGNVYNDIWVDQRSIDWFLLGYEENSTNRTKVLKKGEGELNEMSQYLNEEMVGFGYMKVYDTTQEYPTSGETNVQSNSQREQIWGSLFSLSSLMSLSFHADVSLVAA